MDDGEAMAHFRVASQSDPSAVAGALAGLVRKRKGVAVQAVGAGALNQAVKGVAIARKSLAKEGFDLVCMPTFIEIEIHGEPRTAIRLVLEDRTATKASAPIDDRCPCAVDLTELDIDAPLGPTATPMAPSQSAEPPPD